MFRLFILLFSRFGLGLCVGVRILRVRLGWISRLCIGRLRGFCRCRVILWGLGTFWNIGWIFYDGSRSRCCSITRILGTCGWNLDRKLHEVWINLPDRIDIRFSLCFVLCIREGFLRAGLFSFSSPFIEFSVIRIFLTLFGWRGWAVSTVFRRRSSCFWASGYFSLPVKQ